MAGWGGGMLERVALAVADRILCTEGAVGLAHGFVGDSEVAAFVHLPWCPAHDPLAPDGLSCLLL